MNTCRVFFLHLLAGDDFVVVARARSGRFVSLETVSRPGSGLAFWVAIGALAAVGLILVHVT